MASLTRAGITASRGIFRLSQRAALYASTLSNARRVDHHDTRGRPISAGFDGGFGNLEIVRRGGPCLTAMLDYHLFSLASKHAQDDPLECVPSLDGRRRWHIDSGINE